MKIQLRSLLVLVSSLCVLNLAPKVAAQANVQSILLNEQGVLEPGDYVLETDDSLYDVYTFQGNEGDVIAIALESYEFYAFLILMDPDYQVIAGNDGSTEQSLNSSLEIALPASGTYTVIVNGLDSESWGQYALVVSSVTGASTSGVANSSVEELRQQALSDFRSGNYWEAIENYTQIIQESEGTRCDYFYRGNAYYVTGNYQRAIEDYSSSRSTDGESCPNQGGFSSEYEFLDAELYFNRGNARYMSGDYSGAIEDYNLAIEAQAKNSDDSQFPRALYNRGLALAALDREEEATASFNELINMYEKYLTGASCERDETCDWLVPPLDDISELNLSQGIADIFLEPVWLEFGPGRRSPSGANYYVARMYYQRGLAASNARNYSLARSLLTTSANAFRALGRTQEEAQARNALSALGR